MKKIVCLVFALMLCLSVAMAEAPVSPTSLLKVIVDPEGPAFLPVDEAFMGPYAANFQRQIELCNREVPKLAASSVEEYFAGIDAKAIVGADELNVYEMYGLVVAGFKAEDGDYTITIQFPTPYTPGDKVAVAMGTDNGENVDWTAVEGNITDDGSVQFVVGIETLLALQAGVAMIAVISK
ncbi:MAG: hypothetical protein IKH57_05740 [Clostridia bacterium]|nr:hypothetical protein [Clostridia bacterium]